MSEGNFEVYSAPERASAFNPFKRLKDKITNYKQARAVEREMEDALLALASAGLINLGEENPVLKELAKEAYEAEATAGQAGLELMGAMAIAGVDKDSLDKEIYQL